MNKFQSPDGSSSLPSLCSPNSLNQDDDIAFMSTNLNDDDIDLSMRAPYIPMNENDDLPLLTEDLMWSAFSDEMSLHKSIKDTITNHHADATLTQTFDSPIVRKSNLAALLSGQQDNATCKDITKQFTSSNNTDMNQCHLSKLTSNGTSNSFAINRNNNTNNNNGNNHLNTTNNSVSVGLLNSASDTNAFNQSHNTQPIDDDSAEIIETHDQQKTDDDGIIGTDTIASIHVEYDDDSFPKSCKCLRKSGS